MQTSVLILGVLVAYASASCPYYCTPVCRPGGGARGDLPDSIVGELSQTWKERPFPSKLTHYDRNHDGHISLKEFAKGFHGSHLDFSTRHLFGLSDSDGDGFLNRIELQLAPLRFN